MPLDAFKRRGAPGFPEFTVSTRKNKYTFRQTGTDGQDPVITVALSGGSALEIRMVVTKPTHPHDWTYALTACGTRHRYRFGTCDQLLARLPHVLEELEGDPATVPTEGPGLSVGPA